jgi:hypothetical protein
MLKLISNITITQQGGDVYSLKQLAKLEIKKSRDTLTNTATITLPRNIKLFQNNRKTDLNNILVRGSKITIELGYEQNQKDIIKPGLKTEFTGYITELSSTIPVEIKCQDEMWNLKKNTYTHSWKDAKLDDIVKYIYDGERDIVDLKTGNYQCANKTTAQILEELKIYTPRFYFDANGVLKGEFAGQTSKNKNQELNEAYYDFSKNIIKNDLVYKLKQDAPIKLLAISNLDNGKKIELTLGDTKGEVHTLNYYNMDQNTLQTIASNEISRLWYDGYRGTFTQFGVPYVEPGYVAVLHDALYPEHDGSYLIEAIETTFGIDGFRRKVQLERALA